MAIPEEVASRFAPYIRELHELFAMHGVPFGHPEDLHTFNLRIAAPGTFSEDVSSILRSIILREGGSLPHAELLEVLALAVSGREVDPASAEMQPEFRKLLTFVGAVAGRPWNVPPSAEAVAAAPPTPRTDAVPPARAVPQAPSPATSASPSPGSSSANGNPDKPPPPAHQSAIQRPSIRFTARDDSDHEPRTEPLPPVASVPKSFPSSAPLWIGALCAIALVIGVVFYSHASLPKPGEHARDSDSITLPEPVAAPQPAPETKPTPDVPPAPEQKLKPTPPAPAASVPARTSQPAPVPPARAAQTPKPAATPVRPAAEPTPDAMLAAAQPEEIAGEDDVAGPPGPHAALRSPTTHAGKGPFFLVSSGIMASHLLEAPPPGYPMMARLTHIQGQVILQAVISTDGQVIATRVLSGHRLLRGAAVNAVKRWRYRPYIMNGHPVNVATIITVDFHTHN